MLPCCAMTSPLYLQNSTKPKSPQHPECLVSLPLLFCKYVWVLFLCQFICFWASSFQKDFKEDFALYTLAMEHKMLLHIPFLFFTSTAPMATCPNCDSAKASTHPWIVQFIRFATHYLVLKYSFCVTLICPVSKTVSFLGQWPCLMFFCIFFFTYFYSTKHLINVH